MTRSFKYPLRPTRAQAATLSRWLGVCCDLYNAALQERRDAYRVARKLVTAYDQTSGLTAARADDPELATMPQDVQRSALRRLDKAFGAFFRRCKSGGAPGYPRFRSRRRYDSLSFRWDSRLSAIGPVDGSRVVVPKLGPVKFHRYRPLGGRVRQTTIGRDPAGGWFVSFICDIGLAPAKLPVRDAVGIDLGLTSFATLSDGSDVPNPRFFRVGEAALARHQKALARRRRGSSSRERAYVLGYAAGTYLAVRPSRAKSYRDIEAEENRRWGGESPDGSRGTR